MKAFDLCVSVIIIIWGWGLLLCPPALPYSQIPSHISSEKGDRF